MNVFVTFIKLVCIYFVHKTKHDGVHSDRVTDESRLGLGRLILGLCGDEVVVHGVL